MRKEPVCPHCGKRIDSKLVARWFAARGGSQKKNYSPEERERRRLRMLEVTRQRLAKNAKERVEP